MAHTTTTTPSSPADISRRGGRAGEKKRRSKSPFSGNGPSEKKRKTLKNGNDSVVTDNKTDAGGMAMLMTTEAVGHHSRHRRHSLSQAARDPRDDPCLLERVEEAKIKTKKKKSNKARKKEAEAKVTGDKAARRDTDNGKEAMTALGTATSRSDRDMEESESSLRSSTPVIDFDGLSRPSKFYSLYF